MALLEALTGPLVPGRFFMLRSLFILAIFVPGFIAALRNRYAALILYL